MTTATYCHWLTIESSLTYCTVGPWHVTQLRAVTQELWNGNERPLAARNFWQRNSIVNSTFSQKFQNRNQSLCMRRETYLHKLQSMLCCLWMTEQSDSILWLTHFVLVHRSCYWSPWSIVFVVKVTTTWKNLRKTFYAQNQRLVCEQE